MLRRRASWEHAILIRERCNMEIKPIRSDADHDEALREIERLWGAAEGTAESDRLEVLVTLVEAYERTHHPIDPPDPIEAIRFRLEQQGEVHRQRPSPVRQ